MHRSRGSVRPRTFVGLYLLICASSLASASANPHPHARADPVHPSNFDYLVLASMADSPHLLAMSGYRSWRAL